MPEKQRNQNHRHTPQVRAISSRSYSFSLPCHVPATHPRSIFIPSVVRGPSLNIRFWSSPVYMRLFLTAFIAPQALSGIHLALFPLPIPGNIITSGFCLIIHSSEQRKYSLSSLQRCSRRRHTQASRSGTIFFACLERTVPYLKVDFRPQI
jgi:hypothetical protein